MRENLGEDIILTNTFLYTGPLKTLLTPHCPEEINYLFKKSNQKQPTQLVFVHRVTEWLRLAGTS